MNKRERVEAVLSGKKPDRLPVSFWYHFGTQHMGGEAYAELALAFFRYYDLDWLKLMNDFYYPMPEGLLEVKSRKGLEKITPVALDSTNWVEQFKVLKIVRKELEGKALFIDTVFDPWQTLQRNIVGEHLERLARDEPEALEKALDVVTETLIQYCKKSLSLGSSGIYLSTFGSRDQLARDLFLRFAKPYVTRIFEEIKNDGIMNTAHIHDTNIYTDDVVDLPVQVLSYEDRYAGNPPLSDMKNKFNGCFMGGLDKHGFVRVTPASVIRNALEGLKQAEEGRVLLAPGCSVANWFYPDSVKELIYTVHNYKGLT